MGRPCAGWSNAPSANQGRGVRLGWDARAQGLFGTGLRCQLLRGRTRLQAARQRALVVTTTGGDQRAENALLHGVLAVVLGCQPATLRCPLRARRCITGQPSLHALQLGPVFLDACGADPRSVDVPNTRAIVDFLFPAPVLPCRRHQCMHSSLSRALPLPRSLWREASRRDAGMARRSAPWKRKDGRSFPSTAKFRRFLRTGGGSQLGADLLLLLRRWCIQYNSPLPMLSRLL